MQKYREMRKQKLWTERRNLPLSLDRSPSVDHVYRKVFRNAEADKREILWKKLSRIKVVKLLVQGLHGAKTENRNERDGVPHGLLQVEE